MAPKASYAARRRDRQELFGYGVVVGRTRFGAGLFVAPLKFRAWAYTLFGDFRFCRYPATTKRQFFKRVHRLIHRLSLVAQFSEQILEFQHSPIRVGRSVCRSIRDPEFSPFFKPGH